MRGLRIRHARWPKDSHDLVAVLGASVPLLVLVAALVIAIRLLVPPAWSVLVLLTVVVLALLHRVWFLRVDEHGLHFVRAFGRPKYLSWSQLITIRPATSREVIVWGWLLPPFPPREATNAFTAAGHYRIEWRGGYSFYPPEPTQEAMFLAAIAAHRPDLGTRQPPN